MGKVYKIYITDSLYKGKILEQSYNIQETLILPEEGNVLTDPEACITWEEGARLLGSPGASWFWPTDTGQLLGLQSWQKSGFHGGGGPLALTQREPWEKRV